MTKTLTILSHKQLEQKISDFEKLVFEYDPSILTRDENGHEKYDEFRYAEAAMRVAAMLHTKNRIH